MKFVSIIFLYFLCFYTQAQQVIFKDSIVSIENSKHTYNNFSLDKVNVQIVLNDDISFQPSTNDKNTFIYSPFKDVNIIVQATLKNRDHNLYSESDLKNIGKTLETDLNKKHTSLGFSYNTLILDDINILHTNYLSSENNNYHLYSQYFYSLNKHDFILMCYVQTSTEEELNEIIEKYLPVFQEMAVNNIMIEYL